MVGEFVRALSTSRIWPPQLSFCHRQRGDVRTANRLAQRFCPVAAPVQMAWTLRNRVVDVSLAQIVTLADLCDGGPIDTDGTGRKAQRQPVIDGSITCPWK